MELKDQAAGGTSAEILALLRKTYTTKGQRAFLMKEAEISSAPYLTAKLYARLGNTKEAFQELEKAYEERSGWLAHLNFDPEMDNLRGDARFADLLRRLRLAN